MSIYSNNTEKDLENLRKLAEQKNKKELLKLKRKF